MRTLIVIVSGLLLACAFVFGAGFMHKSKLTGSHWFMGLWLLFCAVDFYVGVFHAGYPAKDEAVIHLVVFGIPALAAWLLPRLFAN